MTYSSNARAHDQDILIIWDIRRGEVMRPFDPDGLPVWPIFKWSKDDKYFAKIGLDVLSIYETPVSIFHDVLSGQIEIRIGRSVVIANS